MKWDMCLTYIDIGCNFEHGYCTKPNECVCNVGWSGSNCTECVSQQNCPGACSTPAGCVCFDPKDQEKGICQIQNNPPKFTKYQKRSIIDQECLIYNKIQQQKLENSETCTEQGFKSIIFW